MFNGYKYESIENIFYNNLDIDLEETKYEEGSYFELGAIINHGYFSTVLKIDEYFLPKEIKNSFKNPVLIITVENKKEDLIRNTFGLKTVNIDNETIMENLDSQLYRFLSNIRNVANFFFMEELEIVDDLNYYSVEFAEELFKYLFSPEGYGYEFKNINFNSYEKFGGVKNIMKSNERFDKETVQEGLVLFDTIINDVSKSANIVENEKVYVDIHEEQFAKINGEIRMIDPFTILRD